MVPFPSLVTAGCSIGSAFDSAVRAVEADTARSRSVADCALKAAAMAMAPLTPVPATRQITVL